jgi:hypothetical protein
MQVSFFVGKIYLAFCHKSYTSQMPAEGQNKAG